MLDRGPLPVLAKDLMVAFTRSHLPHGAQKVEVDLWVSNGRAYREVNNHFVCEGKYKPTRRAFRKGKLTEDDASFIRSQLEAGANGQWLRRKYRVTAVTIHNIGKGKIWKNVEAPIMELEGPPRGVHKEFWDEYISEEDYEALDWSDLEAPPLVAAPNKHTRHTYRCGNCKTEFERYPPDPGCQTCGETAELILK